MISKSQEETEVSLRVAGGPAFDLRVAPPPQRVPRSFAFCAKGRVPDCLQRQRYATRSRNEIWVHPTLTLTVPISSNR
jgi:hypothetical protein